MKNFEEELAKIIRIEIDTDKGKTYIVFEATSEQFAKEIRNEWSKDIEFKIINNKLHYKE